MAQNNLGNVRVYTPERKKSKHNLRNHVSTSMSFTDINVLQCVPMDKGDKHIIKPETMIYCAPILSPFFGKINYHSYWYYIRYSDLTQNFAALMSETAVSRAKAGLIKPKKVPNIPLSILSLIPLCGAHMTMWVQDVTSLDPAILPNYTLYSSSANSASGEVSTNPAAAVFQDMVNKGYIEIRSRRRFDEQDGAQINWRLLLSAAADIFKTPEDTLIQPSIGESVSDDDTWIPLNNFLFKHFIDSRTSDNQNDYDFNGTNQTPVGLGEGQYDYVVDKSWNIDGNIYKVAFAFRFSDFGKRWRKLIEGVGYRMNLSDNTVVSFMPFLAVYFAYYHSFGILRYTNWEYTDCCRLLTEFDNYDVKTYNSLLHWWSGHNTTSGFMNEWLSEIFCNFVKTMGTLFTTDSVDIWAAHQRTANFQNTDVNSLFNKIVDISGGYVSSHVVNGQTGTESSNLGDDFRAYIYTASHGQLDAEILLKLSRLQNVDTISGQVVRNLLRAGGYDFIKSDSSDASFLREFTVPIKANPVLSRSDTYQSATGDGLLLGERGANGEGYSEGESFDFEAPEMGLLVNLAAIIPESDFCQGLSESAKLVSKYDFYAKEFDGAGYTMTRKHSVCDSVDWIHSRDLLAVEGPTQASFGLIPTYSLLKIIPSKICGDFSLPSRREYALQYTLDKFIKLNDMNVENVSFADGGNTPSGRTTVVKATPTFNASELPICGDVWRFVNRYEWLSHLYRIFAVKGDSFEKFWHTNTFAQAFELLGRTYDNFLVMTHYDWTMYSEKLQLADSFETTDDCTNDGKTNSNISKA